jgi:hypothetical protein
MDTQIITALIAVGGTLLGGMLTAFIASRGRRYAKLEARVILLAREVAARQQEENIACDWLGELLEKSPHSVKTMLRDRTVEQYGIRPAMSPSEVSERGEARKQIQPQRRN